VKKIEIIAFATIEAFDDYNEFALMDKPKYKRVKKLIKDILRHPFEGIGKQEPLKYNLAGAWSRRINDEHRLVYKVEDGVLYILSVKYHYD
jgi:toxin YoeB